MTIPGGEQALVQAACLAAEAAYAPYSKFNVGAALATVSGRIVTGCNVENASFGLTICAERTAVGKAVSEGLREFVAIAVCVPGGATPCGACRQVLHEFNPNLLILVAAPDGKLLARYRLIELLPYGFGSSNLEGKV